MQVHRGACSAAGVRVSEPDVIEKAARDLRENRAPLSAPPQWMWMQPDYEALALGLTCQCGHSIRLHEDQTEICDVPDCRCPGFQRLRRGGDDGRE
jgi:hypothetical protein